MNQKKNKLSVVISIHNLGKGVDPLFGSLVKVMDDLSRPFEIVFVDDGSTDNTAEKLAAIAKKDKRVRYVQMRSSFGEASALDAGLHYSTGECIVYLSGRVQVNPRGIPRLLAVLEKGNDLIVGRRSPRKDSRLNQWSSRLFNWVVSRVTRVRLHDINSGVLVTYRSVMEKISFYGDLYNFIPVLANQQGYRVAEETIEQLPGSYRVSKYPREYIQRFLDIITVFFLTRYSKKPIHFLGFVGTLFVVLGLIIEIYLFIYRIFQFGGIAGRPLLLLGALLLVIGIQMISIGLLGEMIIFTHAGEVEEYNVKKVIN